MAKFKFTLLLCVSLVFAFAASSNASTFDSHRRDHADLGRLLKKRTPIDVFGSQPSAQTPSTSPAAQPTQAASAQTTPTNSVSVPTTAASVASSSTTDSGGLLSTVVGELLSTHSDATSSSVPTTTSTTSSHSSSTPLTSAKAGKSSAADPTQSILYLTTSSAPTPTQSSSASSSSMSHTAMTILIVIAACVGAAVIAWTIIRKWKFRPSSDFEGRMQPIDWQPGGGSEDTGLPGQHRPLSRASSFHSGSASGHGHADDQARGPAGGFGTPVLNPIPNHDFTAGPAHLASVGGYADLARGPSPQPMMQEPLGRAPSIRPIQYDQYGIPLHHGYIGY